MRLLRAIPLVLLGLACACKATGKRKPAMTPGADPLADAESQLADNATQLRALGLQLGTRAAKDEEMRKTTEPPSPPPPPPDVPAGGSKNVVAPTQAEPETNTSSTASTRAADRCTQICDLAEVACALQQQICTLAESHVGEPRYEDACWRARDQCDVGQDACTECSRAG